MDFGFGSSTSINLNLAGMMSMVIGIGYPSSDEELAKSTFWRAFYLCPIPFTLTGLLMVLYIHTSDSLVHHLERSEKEEALKILK